MESMICLIVCVIQNLRTERFKTLVVEKSVFYRSKLNSEFYFEIYFEIYWKINIAKIVQ